MIDFPHLQSAHCESGVAANLLSHKGIAFSEAMAFGVGGGLFFGYLPFIRINGLPLVTYRSAAGHILKRIGRIPGVGIYQKTFRDKGQAMAELDAALDQSIPVGLQTGVYWLPYFPKALRFHFNAHNLVVYGKDGDEYLISDPVFPGPVRCPAEDLIRARFASGALAPKGKMYYLTQVPDQLQRRPLIVDGITVVCKNMLDSHFPLIGVKGIQFMAGRLEKWPERLGRERADLHLGHVVRMQEEIGTGGGGFRFMYAAFLQESANELQDTPLAEAASMLTAAGDSWREFAVMAARICKNRTQPQDSYVAMAEQIRECGALEERFFRKLEQWLKQQS
ncbi:BtrH N-terminal domain-containing protein [Desulforhopalus sp. IMCC35007]|uniref:BtrH N-terminal domain-containing protein n=1 Tax=Desulforhopalus sp. IMCC35007 TaxID=2569543 RepID=UPI001F0D0612|nr:BtrH N-terminal domain-containing protein [Desulforhopalus sp. IMCC35007]